MKARLLKRLAATAPILGLALLAACASPFEARVQSFQAMPQQVQGQSFHIAPLAGENAAGLEFSVYAQMVNDELRKQGFQPAQLADTAQLTVLLDYGSGPGREKLATRPGTYSGFGWGGRGWYSPGWHYPWYSRWGGWGGPWGGWSGWDVPEVYSYTVYPAFLHVIIRRSADEQPLFEGRAESTTRVDDLPAVMPKLVQALFTDFPGTPTRSKVVRVPTSKN